jgi:thioredoxin-like negative regulator of GroEL
MRLPLLDEIGVAAELLGPVLRCARGETAVNVALAQLFMAARSRDEAASALEAALQDEETKSDGDAANRLRRMRALWDDTPDGFASVKAIARTVDHGSATRDADPSGWRELFDRAATVSPEAGVAL